MLWRMVQTGLYAGFLTALIYSVVQAFTVTPLIFEAETYEAAAGGHSHGVTEHVHEDGQIHLHDSDAESAAAEPSAPWEPVDGIERYGFLLPMDESEARVALDLSGRAAFRFDGRFPRDSVGELSTEMVEHFFRSLAESLGAALHIEVRGENTHHMVEACFKAVGRCLRQAFRRDGTELPSTKGAL